VYDLAPEKVGGGFDLVFISDVLVHLRDPQTAIENIFSVMNPGGVFLLATAFDPALDRYNAPLSEYLGTDYSWVWWSHSSKSLRKMMEVAGFSPIDEAGRTRAANPLGEFHKIVLRGRVPDAAGRTAAG
jgi:SAM-dependent methyltransferase